MLFFALEYWQTYVELDSQYTSEEHTYATCDLRNDGVSTQSATYPIGKTTHHASHGIYVLAEDKGNLIDEYVAQHTAGCTCEGSHDGSYPKGEACVESLLYTYYSEEGETNGVEDEEGVVHSHQIFTEYHHPQEGQSGNDEIDGVAHPEGSDIEQHIADGTATNGGYEAYDIGSEEVELLGRGQTDSTDCKGKRADKFDNVYKRNVHHVYLLFDNLLFTILLSTLNPKLM